MTGELPSDMAGQAELAWTHVLRMLELANMSVTDIVKATRSLTRAEDIPAYGEVRSHFSGNHHPASMLSIIPQRVRPEFLLEIEIVAANA